MLGRNVTRDSARRAGFSSLAAQFFEQRRLLYDFWDTALGVACRFAQLESALDRGLPYSPDHRFSRTYVDPYCQERGVFVCSLLKDNPAVVPSRDAPGAALDASDAKAPLEFALLSSDDLRPHGEVLGKCAQGTGMINHPECRARRIHRLVPIAAFAERKDVGFVMSAGAVGALRDSLAAPPPLRDKLPPMRRAVPKIKVDDVEGELSDETVYLLGQANYGRFRFCYEEHEQPANAPVFQGEVVVAVTVNQRGDVRSARAVRSTLKNARAVPCILRSFRALKFSEMSAPLKANVTLTFELVPPPLGKD